MISENLKIIEDQTKVSPVNFVVPNHEELVPVLLNEPFAVFLDEPLRGSNNRYRGLRCCSCGSLPEERPPSHWASA